MRGLSPSALTAVAGVTALVTSLKKMTGMGSQIVNMASHFETVRTELGTVLQDVEKGNALFEKLRKFSFDTTFGVDELASASTQLLNVGKSVQSLEKDLTMLGNLAGGNKTKFAELTSIFAKVTAQGKASAMQLQQINLRGIPITKTLQEMGVVGQASLEDLTKAFEKLTSEGGQFAGAMDNIINTIEGKRGFISDTWKEILVNFGELTGITDTYKQLLDVLYDILDKVNNKLMEWNKDPITKALLQGVFVAVITTLVGVIVGSLIPALTTVVGLLGAINPTVWIGGLAGLGVGLFAGLVKGINSVTNAQKELKDSIQASNNAFYEQGKYKNAKDTYDQSINEIKGFEDLKKQQEEKLKKAREELANLGDFDFLGAMLQGEEYVEKAKLDYEKTKATMENNIALLEGSIKRVDAMIGVKQGAVQVYENMNDLAKVYDNLVNNMESIYQQANESTSELKALEEQLAEVNQLKSMEGTSVVKNGETTLIKFDNYQKAEIDKTVSYLKNKITEQKIKLGEVIEWKDAYKYVTGVDADAGGKQAGQDYVAKIRSEYKKEIDALKKIQTLTGVNQDENKRKVTEAYIEKINTQLKTLFSLKVDDEFKETDNSIQYMNEMLKELNKELETSTENAFPNLIEELQKWVNDKGANGEYGKYALGSAGATALGYSQDATNFAQGFMAGGVIGGIISALIGAMVNVASSMEDFDKAINPITNAMKGLKPIIEQFIGIGADVTDGIAEILNFLHPLITIIGALLKVIRLIGKAVNWLLSILGNMGEGLNKLIEDFIKPFMDWLSETFTMFDDLLSEQEEEKERLKELNAQYKSLSDAIKEQEEYYIRKKRELSAENYNESINSRSVNDMILTPQGRFSTHPDDTIIAMKHPEDLASGKTVMIQPIINDYGNNDVQVRTETGADGMLQLYIDISKKVASDVANGSNGWDNALLARETRIAGRSIGR